MNYRHAYHAGNFADVLKHAVLALVIDYLKRKEAPFRVVDTHAGRARYALTSEEAGKTGEWLSGIGRLLGPDAAPLPAEVEQVLAPYLKAVAGGKCTGIADDLPRQPADRADLMRAQDVLVANELHPEERSELEAALGRDRRAKVMGLDGWIALKSLLPPKERRGVVLIDPPFEQDGELARLAEGLADGLQRFATGIFIGWYPIKDLAAHRTLPREPRRRAAPCAVYRTHDASSQRSGAPQRLRARRCQSSLHAAIGIGSGSTGADQANGP